jgi:hypothetical protein
MNLNLALYKTRTPDEFAAILASKMKPGALAALKSKQKYLQYGNDPVGFCTEVLGETLTPDVIAMMESVRDNLITVAVSSNATGKSHGGARVAVWFYQCHEDCKVFTAAAPPYSNLKNILWGEIGSVVAKNPDMFASHTVTALDIRRGPEDFLTGVSIPSSGTTQEREAKFSGKHQKNMLFVLDEGDAIPDDVYSGIESCMSGGHVRLLIFLNPRQAAGAVFRMQRDNTAHVVHLSALRHPNVVTGKDVIPGAVTRETTVRRINEWTRPLNPDEKIEKESLFIVPDFLIGSTAPRQSGGQYEPLPAGKRKIVNPAFSYMVLGQYPAQGTNQLISAEWISRARARYDIYVLEHGDVPPVGATGIMGLDCAEMGDDLNVAVGRYGGYLTPFTSWGGVDTIVTGSRAIDWYNSHTGIKTANVDATGVGAGVAPHMQLAGCVATGIKVASKPTVKTDMGDFALLNDQLAWSVREWLRTDPSAMLPPNEELLEELAVPTYDTDTGKVRVMKKPDMKEVLKRSPNHFDALKLTFAGTGTFFSDCMCTDEVLDA